MASQRHSCCFSLHMAHSATPLAPKESISVRRSINSTASTYTRLPCHQLSHDCLFHALCITDGHQIFGTVVSTILVLVVTAQVKRIVANDVATNIDLLNARASLSARRVIDCFGHCLLDRVQPRRHLGQHSFLLRDDAVHQQQLYRQPVLGLPADDTQHWPLLVHALLDTCNTPGAGHCHSLLQRQH